jgi:AcrR family transcriptional regulator
MRTRGIAHEETRQQILKTARSLVLKVGHERLSLREIARTAGFSPASLYEYFDGKDAIVQTLAARASGSLRLALDKASKKPAGDDRARLAALGAAYVGWAKSHAEDFLLLFSQLPSKRQSFPEAPAVDSPYLLLLDAVRRARASSAVSIRDDEDVERFAYGLWAAAHGMAMLQLTHLKTFKADFTAADRKVFAALFEGWKD